jgi:hypothetical protein
MKCARESESVRIVRTTPSATTLLWVPRSSAFSKSVRIRCYACYAARSRPSLLAATALAPFTGRGPVARRARPPFRPLCPHTHSRGPNAGRPVACNHPRPLSAFAARAPPSPLGKGAGGLGPVTHSTFFAAICHPHAQNRRIHREIKPKPPFRDPSPSFTSVHHPQGSPPTTPHPAVLRLPQGSFVFRLPTADCRLPPANCRLPPANCSIIPAQEPYP